MRCGTIFCRPLLKNLHSIKEIDEENNNLLLFEPLGSVFGSELPVEDSLEALLQIGVGVRGELEEFCLHATHLVKEFLHVGMGGEAVFLLGF